MRRTALFSLLLLLTTAPACSEVLYARPDAGSADTRYQWGAEIVSDSVPLAAALALAKAADGSRPIEIRLLHAADASETVYSVSLSTFESALRWHGFENARLTIRGQVNQTGTTTQ